MRPHTINCNGIRNGIHHIVNRINGNGINGACRRVNGSLDLKILGMNSDTAVDGIDCALVHYRQSAPKAPLHIDLLKVGSSNTIPIQNRQPLKYDKISVPR